MTFVQEDNAETMIVNTLQTAGIQKGQRVVDFGCGAGDYAIPAAKIVGQKGVVYAIDKDNGCLQSIGEKAHSMHMNNLQIVKTDGELHIPVPSGSVNVVLLYDVLHSDYFTPAQRKILFEEIHRIATRHCIISIYPHHIDPGIVFHETADAKTSFSEKIFVDLLHNHTFKQDYLFNFTLP